MCPALHIVLPNTLNPFAAYPWAAHAYKQLEWLPIINKENCLYLQSLSCKGHLRSFDENQPCITSSSIKLLKVVQNMVNRME
jgi:hypothetical protein